MTVPNCPSCGAPLEKVLDLSYGYWEWDGQRYLQRFSGPGVRVPPFACGQCLRGVEGLHPADAATWPVPVG